MATVYILYSTSIDRFYIGSCLQLNQRLAEHNSNNSKHAFTNRASDWEIYWQVDDLDYQQARNIEAHIKRMKSRQYLKNLSIYPAIIQKLLLKYPAGSSR